MHKIKFNSIYCLAANRHLCQHSIILDFNKICQLLIRVLIIIIIYLKHSEHLNRLLLFVGQIYFEIFWSPNRKCFWLIYTFNAFGAVCIFDINIRRLAKCKARKPVSVSGEEAIRDRNRGATPRDTNKDGAKCIPKEQWIATRK